MRLGVNGLRLMGRRAGVGRYLEYLLRAWSTEGAGPFDEVRVFVPGRLVDPFPMGGPVRLHQIPSRLPAALWEHAVLPLRKDEDDVLFCPSYIVPLLSRERPRVVVHHGSYEAFPEAFPWLMRTRARLLYQTSCRRADRVITVSESSRRDIVRFYGLDPDRIRVIPAGVDEAFHPLDDPARLAARRRAYFPDGRPYVLFVGKLTARRRVPELVQAFSRLRRERRLPHGLVIVGPDSTGCDIPRLAAELGVGEAVRYLPFASHEELVEAYNAADLFVYPSQYEGFGIPVLEAMACGTPVVALENSAFPEFAGGVAHFARDGSVGGLRDAVEEALTAEEFRRRARREGPIRADAYRWGEIARRTLEVLVEVAES